MEENKKKTMILTIIAVSCLLIVVFGATYAYFQVLATNNVTGTNTQGSADTMPKGTLVTNITALKINLDADLMSKENAGVTYYATESGVPVTSATEGSGKYVLATASLNKEGLTYDCGYSYIVTATSKKAITDGSDADVKVTIIGSDGTSKTYTLAQLLSGEEIYIGKIKGLTYGENQKIYVEAYVENANKAQDDLAGNEFTFTLALVENSFKCDLPTPTPTPTAAEELIASGKLWSSGLEGDGYRYVGSGAYNSATTPSNFICFGTTDKTECKNNEAKYMYRIIGVFEGSDGEQHLKLISLKQLGKYSWNANYQTDVAWENSDMYKGLNGSYFLTNTTYDYLQNNTWLNKIEDWTWNAVNTKTSSSGPNYYNSLTPSQIYLHEMNRSSKTSSIGSWTNPTAKIGLLYASDYTLSLGSSALAITGGTYDNRTTLKTGWMHQSNNDTTASTREWTLSRSGDSSGFFRAWVVSSDGYVIYYSVNNTLGARPVFHLTSDARISGGNGSYSNPYILSE